MNSAASRPLLPLRQRLRIHQDARLIIQVFRQNIAFPKTQQKFKISRLKTSSGAKHTDSATPAQISPRSDRLRRSGSFPSAAMNIVVRIGFEDAGHGKAVEVHVSAELDGGSHPGQSSSPIKMVTLPLRPVIRIDGVNINRVPIYCSSSLL